MRSSMQIQTRLWRIFFCLIPLSHPFQAINAEDGIVGRRMAVVIGVNAYRPNSGLGVLQHAVKDANRLSEVLRKSGYTVVEMTHDVAREPGKEVLAPYLPNIRDQLSGVLGTPNLGRHDSVLITLHGHGVHFNLTESVTRNGKTIEQRTPKFYFCPADASIRDIESANELTDKNGLLPLDEIYEVLGACKAATKLLIVDACRNDPTQSGGFRDRELKSLTMPKIPPPPGGLAAFLSCRESQRAVEDKDLGQGGQGVFTHFLIRGLEGKADQPLDEGTPADGIVTLSELTAYTANNTYAYVLKKYPGVQQSPELKGEFDANLAVVRLSAKVTSATVVEDPDFVRGVALLRGIGTQIDGPAAITYLRKAADRDHPLAMAQLASLIDEGKLLQKNPAEVLRLVERSRPRLEELALAGESEAQFRLGDFYDFGVGCKKNDSLAINLYRKAADQNHAIAQYNLGLKYELGNGVSKDLVEAVKLYRKAADQNYAAAQYTLGLKYNNGEGVPKDFVEAVKLYRKAADQNLAAAQNNLGVMYELGNGVSKDLVEAVKWYRKSAEQDEGWGQHNVGHMYQYGQGVAKDEVEAERWFRKVLANSKSDPTAKERATDALKAMGKTP